MSKDEKRPLLNSISENDSACETNPRSTSNGDISTPSRPINESDFKVVIDSCPDDSGIDATHPTVHRTTRGYGRFTSTDKQRFYGAIEDMHTDQREKMEKAAKYANRRKMPGICSLKQRKRVIGIRKYYEYQMSLLDFYLDDSKVVDEGAEGEMATMELDAKAARQRRLDEILAKVTLVINVTLLLAKIVASIMSNSLSVMSTVIDSAVDITSGLVIWLTMRAIVNVNPHDYPRGRTKLEPLAVVIVAIIMGVANIVMIIQSVQSIIDDKVHPQVDIATISILVVGTGLKLVLYIICIRQNSVGSMVLAQDQRNDMITNIVALTCALIGTYLWLYADPIGAILVCGYIAISWFHTAGGQIPILSGHAADGDFTTRILNVVIDHDPRIKCLDEFVCYHYGNKFLVELHVVLDPNITLKESHDISEPLQMKLERLPYVERAFVHCDYKCDAIDHDHAAAEKNKQRVTLSMAHGHAH